MLYLSSYLGSYSILVTAGLGGVYIYSCYSYCGCCGVAGAAIRVAGGIAIRITCNTAVKIVSGIGGAASGINRGFCGDSCWAYCWWVGMSFIDLACCAGCLGAVGVRGDVSALKWDGAYADGAYSDGACLNGACPGKACTDGACTDGAYCGACCGA